jgi:pyruvate formate lyase activating enzyme
MQCVEVCSNEALRIVGTHMTVSKVMEAIIKDRVFYGSDGGVTLSGGEPLFQDRFAISLLQQCNELGIHTVLDTSGIASPAAIQDAVPYTDLVLLDIKHMDPAAHRVGTGVDNGMIHENARRIAGKTVIRISIPIIPGFNDSDDNIIRTSEFAQEIGAEWIDINPLHSLGRHKYRYLGIPSPFSKWKEPEKVSIQHILSIFRDHGLNTTIGRMM